MISKQPTLRTCYNVRSKHDHLSANVLNKSLSPKLIPLIHKHIQTLSLSHPGLGLLSVSSSFPPPPQRLFPLTSKPLELHLRYLWQRIYRSGKTYWMTFIYDLDPRSRLWYWLAKICLHDKVRTTHPITIKHDSFIALVMVITWSDFGEVLLETYFGKFSFKNSDVFLQLQTLFWS